MAASAIVTCALPLSFFFFLFFLVPAPSLPGFLTRGPSRPVLLVRPTAPGSGGRSGARTSSSFLILAFYILPFVHQFSEGLSLQWSFKGTTFGFTWLFPVFCSLFIFIDFCSYLYFLLFTLGLIYFSSSFWRYRFRLLVLDLFSSVSTVLATFHIFWCVMFSLTFASEYSQIFLVI